MVKTIYAYNYSKTVLVGEKHFRSFNFVCELDSWRFKP